ASKSFTTGDRLALFASEPDSALEVLFQAGGIAGGSGDTAAPGFELARPKRSRRARRNGGCPFEPAGGVLEVGQLGVGDGHPARGSELNHTVCDSARGVVGFFTLGEGDIRETFSTRI